MNGRAAVTLALVIGLGAGVSIGACTRGAPTNGGWQSAHQQRSEITALWTQIRDWRREAHMDVEPAPSTVMATRQMSVKKVRSARPCGPQPATPACGDVCGLADAICDNAESICGIASELPGDDWAADKCDSAKASCREAKERCCACDGEVREDHE